MSMYYFTTLTFKGTKEQISKVCNLFNQVVPINGWESSEDLVTTGSIDDLTNLILEKSNNDYFYEDIYDNSNYNWVNPGRCSKSMRQLTISISTCNHYPNPRLVIWPLSNIFPDIKIFGTIEYEDNEILIKYKYYPKRGWFEGSPKERPLIRDFADLPDEEKSYITMYAEAFVYSRLDGVYRDQQVKKNPNLRLEYHVFINRIHREIPNLHDLLIFQNDKIHIFTEQIKAYFDDGFDLDDKIFSLLVDFFDRNPLYLFQPKRDVNVLYNKLYDDTDGCLRLI